MDTNINIPAISVVMAVYNGEKYLKEAVDSILSQTFADFEFIIINDGSTDKTKEIILSYNDKRIKLIDNEKNIGLSASLNKGIKATNGKYIARMDADDISYPERFETQYRFMEKNLDIGLCGSSYKILGTNIKKKLISNTEEIKICLFTGSNCLAHPSVVIRKTIFTKLQLIFNEENQVNQDYELWADIYMKTGITNVPDCLLEYRVHEEQISSTRYEEQQEHVKRIIIKQLNFLNIVPTNEQKRQHLLLTTQEPICSLKEIEQIQQWIILIKNTNRIKKVFDIKMLDTYLARLLEQKQKQFIINRFVLSKYYYPKLYFEFIKLQREQKRVLSNKQKIKLLIKCLFLWKI